MSAERFPAPEGAGPRAPLAVCFAVSAAEAFGLAFLHGIGWEVILVRNRPRTWPRHPPEGLGAALRPLLAGRGAVAYGSSQGGMAALLYARAIGAARVVALSPRASRAVTGGARGAGPWAEAAPGVDWRYAPTPPEVAAPMRVALLYDDTNALDGPIADRIAAEMGDPARLRRVRAPLSGHPSIAFLRDTGQLSAVARALLEEAPLPPLRLRWSAGRSSVTFLVALAQVARARGRSRLAEAALLRALSLSPDERNLWARLVRWRIAWGATGAAVETARTLCADRPDDRAAADLLDVALAADRRWSELHARRAADAPDRWRRWAWRLRAVLARARGR